jgi:glycerol-3-phosphate dehydrogenase (NAD(P)+)
LGDSVAQALASVEGVCEGVPAAQALHEILVSRNVEAPIAHELYQVLVNGKSPKDSLTALLDRDSKAEIE